MIQLVEKTQELLNLMQNQLHTRYEHTIETTQYIMDEGRNYIKLIQDNNGRQSVVGFVVKKSPKAIDNKTNESFKVGDMLMAKSWSAPATNFARGNVFEELPMKQLCFGL
jgi:Ni,Fe-hydrogenase III large subunit